jgi:hypothetical protein
MFVSSRHLIIIHISIEWSYDYVIIELDGLQERRETNVNVKPGVVLCRREALPNYVYHPFPWLHQSTSMTHPKRNTTRRVRACANICHPASATLAISLVFLTARASPIRRIKSIARYHEHQAMWNTQSFRDTSLSPSGYTTPMPGLPQR